jgi:hypothetical protein
MNLVQCPFCKAKMRPMRNGACPACGRAEGQAPPAVEASLGLDVDSPAWSPRRLRRLGQGEPLSHLLAERKRRTWLELERSSRGQRIAAWTVLLASCLTLAVLWHWLLPAVGKQVPYLLLPLAGAAVTAFLVHSFTFVWLQATLPYAVAYLWIFLLPGLLYGGFFSNLLGGLFLLLFWGPLSVIPVALLHGLGQRVRGPAPLLPRQGPDGQAPPAVDHWSEIRVAAVPALGFAALVWALDPGRPAPLPAASETHAPRATPLPAEAAELPAEAAGAPTPGAPER